MSAAPKPLENLTHEQVIERFLGGYAVADIVAQTGWPIADVEAHLERRIRVGPPWQPIEDAPAGVDLLLGWREDDEIGSDVRRGGYYVEEHGDGDWMGDGMVFAVAPTHWQPLPDPPAQDENMIPRTSDPDAPHLAKKGSKSCH